jgi:hypothetical protein
MSTSVPSFAATPMTAISKSDATSVNLFERRLRLIPDVLLNSTRRTSFGYRRLRAVDGAVPSRRNALSCPSMSPFGNDMVRVEDVL